MTLFGKQKRGAPPGDGGGTVVQSLRQQDAFGLRPPGPGLGERQLYDGLRRAVPIVDAAIGKLVRLAGGFTVTCADEALQPALDGFAAGVRVGLSGRSFESFVAGYLESLLTYGSAVGEILVARDTFEVAGLSVGDVGQIEVSEGRSPVEPVYAVRRGLGSERVKFPQLILFTALSPPPGSAYGVSILRGLPALSGILMRIYESVGQNFDRVGNVRYAVTYRPTGDAGDRAYAKERAMQIAKEWSEGMAGSANGQIRDFIAVGDVDIKVIGADNQVLDTQVPVRQLLEQIVAKLGIPPFLLGLSWSTTERLSSQQADLLTSELEHYRRLLTPVLTQICGAFLTLRGTPSPVSVDWHNINLQDEVELSRARLYAAQAAQLEQTLKGGNL